MMQIKKTINMLFLGVLIGMPLGLIHIVYIVYSHRYIQHGMFRLAVRILQNLLNKDVLYFLMALFAVYLLWFLLTTTLRQRRNRALKWLVPLGVLLCVHWILRSFVAETLFSALMNLIRLGGGLLHGNISFLKIPKAHIIATLAFLAGSLNAALLLYAFLASAFWQSMSGIFHKIDVRVTGFILAVLLIILNAGVFLDRKMNVPNGPNVILIGIDTLRADHMGSYGYHRNTTPYMDEIAAEGYVFRRAYATTSWTLPSFHSIFTSLYQVSHGVITDEHRLDNSFLTLAELLQNENYVTAGFVFGPYLKSDFGFDQGFELYQESVARGSYSRSEKDITSPKMLDLVSPWLSKNKNNKFFMFIHGWDPHYDYIPPLPYDQIFDPDYEGDMDGTDIERSDKMHPEMDQRDLEHLIALYDGEIRWTDAHLGKLFNRLEAMGLDENTVLVIVGDHGDEFLEHGGKGHGKTLYNEVIHVPLILKIPGRSRPGLIDSVVSTVDILPTLLDVLEIENPDSVDGKSLLPMIDGKEDRKSGGVYSELGSSLISYITDREKVIFAPASQEIALYDLSKDPLEKNNLFRGKSIAADRLKEKLLAWQASKRLHRRKQAPRTRKDEKTIRQLKSLGYLQ